MSEENGMKVMLTGSFADEIPECCHHMSASMESVYIGLTGCTVVRPVVVFNTPEEVLTFLEATGTTTELALVLRTLSNTGEVVPYVCNRD